jgi:exodeoxyribonuclease VII large subunit
MPASNDIDLAATSASAARSEKRVVRLSDLLGRVANAVDRAVPASVWTVVEVTDVKLRSGHYYLDVAERDSEGNAVAQARACIWRSVAASVVPQFTEATGVQLVAGIKLLVRARPRLHALFGLSLHLDAIDPSFTLGELEARRRKIRAQLDTEGVFNANRSLRAPWDYQAVLVLAPTEAAGLGDFKAEATRLERFGLCSFVYVHSRFQGEGAPAEMLAALRSALRSWQQARGGLPDAVVIIRGGGSVNDLAWLDDLALVRFVCVCGVPVLTGIGHERDRTLLDEVAHTRYDTPSKVIAGIEALIVRRAGEANAAFAYLAARVREVLALEHLRVDQMQAELREGAFRVLGLGRNRIIELDAAVRHDALAVVRNAQTAAADAYAKVREAAQRKAALAGGRLPVCLGAIASGVQRKLTHARAAVQDVLTGIRMDTQKGVHQARTKVEALHTEVASASREGAAAVSHRLLALIAYVELGSEHALEVAGSRAKRDFADIIERSQRATRDRREHVARAIESVADDARRVVVQAREQSENRMREITAQGPQKTLERGFALVRDCGGAPITTAAAARSEDEVELEFRDGHVAARISTKE